MVHLSANTVNDLIFFCFSLGKLPSSLSLPPPFFWIRVAAVCPSVVVAAGPFPLSDDSCVFLVAVTWPTPLLDWNSPWAIWKRNRTTFCATAKKRPNVVLLTLTCCANKHRHHFGVMYFSIKSKTQEIGRSPNLVRYALATMGKRLFYDYFIS